MSLAQRFERRLESLVGGAFARVFKGQVEPVEIGSALQREASDKRNVMGNGAVLAPNRYRVTLGPSDYERLVPWEAQLTMSLAELVQEHLDENRWSTIGDVEVYLARDDSLHTGVFGVASRMESDAPPRRRPHDSMSLPVVNGAAGQPAYGQDPTDGQSRLTGRIRPTGKSRPELRAGPGLWPRAAVSRPNSLPRDRRCAPRRCRRCRRRCRLHPRPRSSTCLRWAHPTARWRRSRRCRATHSSRPRRSTASTARPASGPPQPHAALVVDGTGRQFDLRVGGNIVGRGSESDLQLLDQGVSRKHVNIDYDGSFATIYDLGSTNGTSVNGHHVTSQLLRHGDVVRVGHTKLVFQQDFV